MSVAGQTFDIYLFGSPDPRGHVHLPACPCMPVHAMSLRVCTLTEPWCIISVARSSPLVFKYLFGRVPSPLPSPSPSLLSPSASTSDLNINCQHLLKPNKRTPPQATWRRAIHYPGPGFLPNYGA